MTETNQNLFTELYHKDVNGHTEKVEGLTYLSWAWAWAEVKKVDENASYEIHRFPMLDSEFRAIEGVTVPYLKTPEGYFVEVSVTIGGRTETEMLPVMNNKNIALGTLAPTWVKENPNTKAKQVYKEMPRPTSTDLNKSHKRCLVKAIALHGLGLYIYAGEDVPEVDPEELKKRQEEMAKLEEERKEFHKMIKGILKEVPEVKTVLDEIVQKVKENTGKAVKLEQFTHPMMKKAYDLVIFKANELKNKEEIQTPEDEHTAAVKKAQEEAARKKRLQ